MIQSQSLGGTSPRGGGGANGGEKDYGERHNSRPSPPSRSEKGEFRVHRHDSRDAANGSSREWRRPSKSHEVYRRDDRMLRERWKDRKRWDKPRMRESSRDLPKEGASQNAALRDGSRDGPREFHRDPQYNSVAGDLRGALRSNPSGDRDSRRNSDATNLPMNRPRLSYDEKVEPLYDSGSHKHEMHRTPFSKPGPVRPPPSLPESDNLSQSNSQQGTGKSVVKHPKKFSKRPGDKFRDLLMGAQKAPKAKETSNETESSNGLTADRPSTLTSKPNELRNNGEPDVALTGTTLSSHEHTEASSSESAKAETNKPLKPEANAAEESSHSDDTSAETVVHATETDPIEKTTGEESAVKSPLDGDSHAVYDSNGVSPSIHTKLTDSPSMEVPAQDAQLAKLSSAPTTSGAMVSSDLETSQPKENQMKAPLPMLPQELELHNRLVSELSTLVDTVPRQHSYVSKTWTLPGPGYPVVAAIYEQRGEQARNLEERSQLFKRYQTKWLDQSSRLLSENNVDNAGEEPSPQPKSVNLHSRKRSRDEDVITSQKMHRRNRDRHSRAHGDVARSEAEFLEILASLEAQTARDPLVRARLTSARIPNQSQTPDVDKFESTNALVLDHSVLLRRLDLDGIDNFTEGEHAKFVDAYVQWPKRFGMIAEAVGRSFNDCVMHYYRTKKAENYKRILLQRTKRKRGRKPRKRTEEDSIPSTPTTPSTPKLAAGGSPVTPETVKPNGDVEYVAPAGLQNPDKMPTPSQDPSYAIVPPATYLTLGQMENAVADIHPVVAAPVADTTVEMSDISLNLAEKPRENGPEVSLKNNMDVEMTGAAVPPPVLPIQNMDTGKLQWDDDRINTFERLLAVHGLRVREIATAMNMDPVHIQAFYEFHRQKYDPVLNSVAAQATHPEISQSVKPPPEGPAVGYFTPRYFNKMPTNPGFSPFVQASHVAFSNTAPGLSALNTPPPVLPLDASLVVPSTVAKPATDVSAILPPSEKPIAVPQAVHTEVAEPPVSVEGRSNLPLPLEYSPVSIAIPALLPRTKSTNIKSDSKTYDAFAGHIFQGFRESNERSTI